MRKILIVFGTRPEAIKMAPVISALRDASEFDVHICVTGQHKEMLDQVLDIMHITPDHNLCVMEKNQTLADLTAAVLSGVTRLLTLIRPDLVLVHGDTTSSMAVGMACFYQKVAVGHVEAGLRTNNIYSPWPEEFNRRVVGMFARLHFAPTMQARMNLLSEAIPEENICVTGNTVIDSLLKISERIDQDNQLHESLDKKFSFLSPNKRLILVTGHRRENFGEGIRAICSGLKALATRKDIEIVYPVHLNPNVKNAVEESLSNNSNIHLISPQDYLSFVYLLKRCYLVLTDSGGVQEEAPSLSKPVLVMRDTTERPEALLAGTAKLVGADAEKISKEVSLLLDDQVSYQKMVLSENPYGDGTSSIKIAAAISKYFEQKRQ